MNDGASSRFSLVDLGLLVTVSIWAVNFSVVKASLATIPPLVFNTFRLLGATGLLLTLTALSPRDVFTRRELAQLFFLGLVGHTTYQLLFITGIDRTTASNSALMLAMTPVMVALIGALGRVERVSPAAWAGIGLSVAGAYLVMGSTETSGGSWRGDLLVLAATFCWSAYTVAGKRLLEKHDPLHVTAYSMAIGTALFLPFAVPALGVADWHAAPWTAWAGVCFSFVFALALAYILWYQGVSRVGPTRTAVYSNLTPAAALLVSWVALGERIGSQQIAGAALILLGIHRVRRSRSEGPRA